MGKKINIQILKDFISWNTYLDYLKLISFFDLNKCFFVDSLEEADDIVIITWSATGNAESKEFELIEKLKGYHSKLIVYGNLPETSKGRFQKTFSGRFVTAKSIESIDALFGDFPIKFREVKEINGIDDLTPIARQAAAKFLGKIRY